MYGGGMWFGWIWVLALLVGVGALLWAVVYVITSSGTRRPAPPARAQDIVRERFARGEITEQEMRAVLRVLDET